MGVIAMNNIVKSTPGFGLGQTFPDVLIYPPPEAQPAPGPYIGPYSPEAYSSSQAYQLALADVVSQPTGLPPGPAPRVNVPLTSSSMGMWLTNSTLVSGLPNWGVLAMGAFGIPILVGLVSGARRRR